MGGGEQKQIKGKQEIGRNGKTRTKDRKKRRRGRGGGGVLKMSVTYCDC